MTLEPTLEDFAKARETIEGKVHRTPLFSSQALSARSGYEVQLKAENLQKTGSFKARGAMNKILGLNKDERRQGVVTASAGNHGQAVAYAAALLEIPCYVVMPEAANRSKIAAVEGYGAHAILHGAVWDDAFARSSRLAEEKGLIYVHPFKDRKVIAGQGTIASEIFEDAPDVEAILVPIGGGGLISGIATAAKNMRPEVKIIGVEAEGSANMSRSRSAGEPIALDEVDTIADGLATKGTDPEIFQIVERYVDDFVVVTDKEIMQAIEFLLERAKLLAETAGASAVAALMFGSVKLEPGTKVVATIGGGNFDVSGKLTLEQ